jgi:hypothetical protein
MYTLMSVTAVEEDGEVTSGYILVGKYAGKNPFRRSRVIREDNIKVDLKIIMV